MCKNKRWIAAVLAGVLTASVLAACGKQKIDYSFDEGTQSGGSAEIGKGVLAERLGIPKSYSTDIDPGTSGLTSIVIKDDEIQVPLSDSMRIEYLEGNTMDAAYKQKIASLLFGRSDEIYQFDYQPGDDIVRTKSDIAEEIRIEEWQLQYAEGTADTEWITEIEERIAILEDEYEDAIEEHEPAGDWSASGYIGDRNDVQFRVNFYPYNGIWGKFQYQTSYLFGPSLYRSREGTFQAHYSHTDDSVEGMNHCVWSKDEAVEMARQFLQDCGITDVVVSVVYDLEWTYSTPKIASNDISDISGYFVWFARSIDGNEIYRPDTSYVDTLEEGSEIYETYEVYIDDNGVLEACCYDMFRPTGQTEDNVDLLSFEDVIEIARTVIPEYYTEHKTAYDSILFNDVRLTYFLVNGEKEGSFKYIPAWVFAQYDEYGYPIQLIMLDAMTGELVDLNERKYVDIGSVFGNWQR